MLVCSAPPTPPTNLPRCVKKCVNPPLWSCISPFKMSPQVVIALHQRLPKTAIVRSVALACFGKGCQREFLDPLDQYTLFVEASISADSPTGGYDTMFLHVLYVVFERESAYEECDEECDEECPSKSPSDAPPLITLLKISSLTLSIYVLHP